MAWRSDLAYAYDGSFDGLMTCVFESYASKEVPIDIQSGDEQQYLLFPTKWVDTDLEKAERVYRAIGSKMSSEAQRLVREGFLTCVEQKELLIFRFLRLGFTHGKAVMDMLADDTVHLLQRAVQRLNHESHLFTGFVRFSVYGDVLVSVIEPKNEVLPVLSEHFCERYRNESFMIYDKTHGKALVHQPPGGSRKAGLTDIFEVDEFVLPEPGEEEKAYRRLWKQFYDTVAIKERISPRRQMSHMPKRYWANLTEMSQDGVKRLR